MKKDELIKIIFGILFGILIYARYFIPFSPSISILILFIGIFVLVEGSNLFVDGAAGVAAKMGISEHAVGLTLVAFGTSFPEFAVSFIASLKNHVGISVGNVMGSNVTNILLIMGVAMLLVPLKPSKFAIRDAYYMLTISILAILLSLDNSFQFYDGIVFLAFYVIFIYMLYKRKSSEAICEATLSPARSLIFLLLGGAAVIIGGDSIVGGAAALAKLAGLSEVVIAASIVAFGTSLPELMTSVMATLKDYHGIAIGNIIGSNIVNIGIVLGSSCMIRKIPFSINLIAIFFIVSALMATIMIKNAKYGRSAGVLFLLFYVAFVLSIYIF